MRTQRESPIYPSFLLFISNAARVYTPSKNVSLFSRALGRSYAISADRGPKVGGGGGGESQRYNYPFWASISTLPSARYAIFGWMPRQMDVNRCEISRVVRRVHSMSRTSKTEREDEE